MKEEERLWEYYRVMGGMREHVSGSQSGPQS